MRLPFRKDKSVPMDTRSLAQMYADSSIEELISELDSSLKSYKHFKHGGIPLEKHLHFDLYEETVLARASIHDSVNELHKRGRNVDTQEISSLDRQWQEWILENKSSDFELVDLNRDDEPKDHWWWWIDQLETLSDSEKSTL